MNFVGYENDDDDNVEAEVHAQFNVAIDRKSDEKIDDSTESEVPGSSIADHPIDNRAKTSEIYMRLCERIMESRGTYSFEQQFRATTLFQHPNLVDEIASMGNLSSLSTQLSNDILPLSWNGQHHPGKINLDEIDNSATATEKR